MKKYFWIGLFIAQVLLISASANDSTKITVNPVKKNQVAKQAPPVTEVKVGEFEFPKEGIKGKISKIIRVNSYQYIEFKDYKTERTLWLATTVDKIRSGDQIEIAEGSVMSDFYGRDVNMHFDFIIFTEKIKRTSSKSKK